MSSNADAEYTDLVQVAGSGSKVQDLIDGLGNDFSIGSIQKKQGWAKVECSSSLLDKVKVEFKKEFERSREVANVVSAIIGRPAGTLHLARKVQLGVFQDGWSDLRTLVGNDDCIVLIPVAITGSAEVTVRETNGRRRQATYTCTTNTELMISGRCSLWVPPESKLVCVVLCIAKDKG